MPNLPRKIPHLTFNTGHTRESPRDEVGPEAITLLRPLLTPGDHPLPRSIGDYRIKVTPIEAAVMVTVFGPLNRPLVTFGVAANQESSATLWGALEQHYLTITELPILRSAGFKAPPRRPSRAPWLAAITIYATPDEAAWIADLERCFAWCWLEHRDHPPDRPVQSARN